VEAPEKKISFEFPADASLGTLGPVLQLKEVSFGYPGGKTLFSNVSLSATAESRIALLGLNGSGKSTLINLIRGALQPTKGEIFRHHNLKMAYFSQHHVDQLNLQETPLQHLAKMFPNAKEQELRAHLGSFGLGKFALQPIGTLSGGQQSRVAFAQITFQHPHLLVLDEPTNHLDFDTISGLTEALENFEGGILMVSHHLGLISEVAKEVWVVASGQVKKYASFEEYRSTLS